MTNSDTGKQIYSWTFSGTDLKNSVASVTGVNLALDVVPVKNDAAASAVIANNTADRQTPGVVLKFGHQGLLLELQQSRFMWEIRQDVLRIQKYSCII